MRSDSPLILEFQPINHDAEILTRDVADLRSDPGCLTISLGGRTSDGGELPGLGDSSRIGDDLLQVFEIATRLVDDLFGTHVFETMRPLILAMHGQIAVEI